MNLTHLICRDSTPAHRNYHSDPHTYPHGCTFLLGGRESPLSECIQRRAIQFPHTPGRRNHRAPSISRTCPRNVLRQGISIQSLGCVKPVQVLPVSAVYKLPTSECPNVRNGCDTY